MTNYIATVEDVINADPEDVWEALTNPAKVKEYMFGAEVTTDWQEGSGITYKGEWDGKPYEDKGKILHVKPNKMLQMTYWSPLSGKEDAPENYNTVTYTLEKMNGKTRFIVEQDNNPTKEAQEHSEKNWRMMLDGLKKVAEAR